MGSDTPNKLFDWVISGGRDASLFEDLATHVRVSDTKQKLLFLGALSGRQTCGQEIFHCRRHLVLGDGHNILKSFLSSLERVACGELHHFGEALEAQNGLLNLWKLSTGLIKLLLLEEAVAGGTLVQNEKLRHSDDKMI